MIKIAFLGASSAGKSTLSARLFAELKERGVKTELVQEYVREHINRVGKIHSILNQYLIYEKQLEKEEIVPEAIQVIITDSPVILSYIYALYYVDLSKKEDQQLILNMYQKVVSKDLRRYDLIYFLESTRPYVEDGTRGQTKEQVLEISKTIKSFLKIHKVSFTTLGMPETEKRLEVVLQDLKSLKIL